MEVLRNARGITLIDLVVSVVMVALLLAIGIPRFIEVTDSVEVASARAVLAAGKTAVIFDFSQQILQNGTYTAPFSGTEGKKFNNADRATIESMMEYTPIYPPSGDYGEFKWWLVSKGASSPGAPEVPVIAVRLGGLTLQ